MSDASNTPPSGTDGRGRNTRAAVLAAVIAAGCGGDAKPVPDVAGMQLADAKRALSQAGNDADVAAASSDAAPAGSAAKADRARERRRAAAAKRKARRAARARKRARERRQARAEARRRAHAAAATAEPDAGSVYYENCDAARAAGAAPVSTGEPGYGSHLDRDGDGVGCEN